MSNFWGAVHLWFSFFISLQEPPGIVIPSFQNLTRPKPQHSICPIVTQLYETANKTLYHGIIPTFWQVATCNYAMRSVNIPAKIINIRASKPDLHPGVHFTEIFLLIMYSKQFP